MEANFGSSRQAETKDHMLIELMLEENLVLSIKERMENVSLTGSICRVPDELLKGNEEGYFPRLVSIGPLHHGKSRLSAVEDLKWRYLNALLGRKSDIMATLDLCIKTLKNLEQKARKCYTGNFNMGSNQFVQMMLVDGCFIIELFLKLAIKGLRRRDDPFFTKNEQFLWLRCDLVLLENQLPFFVLQQLYQHVAIPKQCSQSLVELALFYFRKIIPGNGQFPYEKFGPDIHHLLDLIRQCHLPTIPQIQALSTQKRLPTAAQLKSSGINLKAAVTDSLLNITFDDNLLEIPPLKVHKHTEILFKNLVALEYYHCKAEKHIISYVLLMEQLIKSEEDVRILHRKRILIEGLEKQEEIINLFKKLKVDVNAEDFYYRWLCEEVDEHIKIKGQIQWCQKIKNIYRKLH